MMSVLPSLPRVREPGVRLHLVCEQGPSTDSMLSTIANENRFDPVEPARKIGLPLTIPQATQGSDTALAPGPWAKYGNEIPWSRGRVSGELLSDSLQTLYAIPSVREPQLRANRYYSPGRFDQLINTRIENMESFGIQCKEYYPALFSFFQCRSLRAECRAAYVGLP